MRPEIESKLSELKFSLASLDHAGTRREGRVIHDLEKKVEIINRMLEDSHE